MLLLFIIRRLSPRALVRLGAVLTLAGLVVLGLAASVASWLVIHGIITIALGIAFCAAAYVGHKKRQSVAGAQQKTPGQARSASPAHR
ncbi:MAG: hypothetical protein ACRDLT_12035 [Solirubrobacteraceae bacterium]